MSPTSPVSGSIKMEIPKIAFGDMSVEDIDNALTRAQMALKEARRGGNWNNDLLLTSIDLCLEERWKRRGYPVSDEELPKI